MLTDIFVRRPVLATVVSLLILLVGARALLMLNVRQYPETEKAVVTVSTVYTGASASLVKGFVTAPLERAIASADGIDILTSTSARGVSVIRANLRLNYDANQALSQINTKVNSVRGDLPAEARDPVIDVTVGQTTAAMYISFHSDTLAANQITDYLRRVVQPELETVQGVQEARILGARPIAMRVWLRPQAMAALGVTPLDVRRALEANNVLSALGGTEGTLVALNARAETTLHTAEDFAALVIRDSDGALVRLGDVARLELGAETTDSLVTFDGRAATFMAINILPDANPLEVVARVRDRFADVQARLPDAITAEIVHDATDYIEASIAEVQRTIAIALVVVIVVIFLFLGSLRSVLVPVVAIPLSLVGAAFVMWALGYSINLLTLLAMVLAIGLVVDDAIVVVENVQRHVEEGMDRTEAALRGARELANPIIATTLTLVAVYAPIGFMGGLTGALFSEFAFSLVGAVVISSIVALTLSPMMASKVLKEGGKSGRLAAALDRVFDRLRRGYGCLLDGAIAGRWVVVGVCVLTLGGLVLMLQDTRAELAPQEDQGFVIVQASGAPTASFDQMVHWTGPLNAIMGGFPEAAHTFTAIGGGPTEAGGVSSVFGGLPLKPWDEREGTTQEVQAALQKKVGGIAGLDTAVFLPPPLPAAGEGLPIQFVIGITGDTRALWEQATAVAEAARQSGDFAFVDNDLKYDAPQLVVDVDRARAADLGLTMRDIAGNLGTVLAEAYVNRFSLQGRSYQVIPQAPQDNRRVPEDLGEVWLRGADGALVPARSVVTLDVATVPRQLNRFQQLDAATIGAVPAEGVSMGAALQTLRDIAAETLPPDTVTGWAGPSRQMVQEQGGLLMTFGLTLLVIYLVLAALYESFRDPIIILVSVPLALAGAVVFLWLGWATLNIYSQVGLITLVALIAKHGILIVQFANQLQRDEARDRRAAVRHAAMIRLRPVLMTAASMVAGMVPLLTATGAGANSRFAIGLVIAAGLGLGTLFTLFVVPPIYTLVAADKRPRERETPAAAPAATGA